MIVERQASGAFLSAKLVEDLRITSVVIKDEGRWETYTPQGKDQEIKKFVVSIDYRGRKEGEPDKWSCNKKSFNAIFDLYGPDTAKWIGKTVELTLEGSGEYRHIAVDSVRSRGA